MEFARAVPGCWALAPAAEKHNRHTREMTVRGNKRSIITVCLGTSSFVAVPRTILCREGHPKYQGSPLTYDSDASYSDNPGRRSHSSFFRNDANESARLLYRDDGHRSTGKRRRNRPRSPGPPH